MQVLIVGGGLAGLSTAIELLDFNAYADASNIVSEYRGRSGSIIHFVVAPAEAWIGKADEAIVKAVVDDFRDVFPAAREARVVKSVVVKTPLAFHRQSPGMEQYRPVARTPVRKLMLAGEFTRNKYPPCMEGAVMSGILAAESVHESRGQPIADSTRRPIYNHRCVSEIVA